MNKEIESLYKNRRWELVKPPERKKMVTNGFSRRKKGTPGTEDTRYKARLVAKGYSQVKGVNFNDVSLLL